MASLRPAKVTVQSRAGGSVGLGGFRNVGKSAKTNRNAVRLDLRSPKSSLLTKAYTLEAACIFAGHYPVSGILRNRCGAKIGNPVIRFYPVNVINSASGPRAGRHSPNHTMRDVRPMGARSDGANPVAVAVDSRERFFTGKTSIPHFGDTYCGENIKRSWQPEKLPGVRVATQYGVQIFGMYYTLRHGDGFLPLLGPVEAATSRPNYTNRNAHGVPQQIGGLS
jgi:hypothetical protein